MRPPCECLFNRAKTGDAYDDDIVESPTLGRNVPGTCASALQASDQQRAVSAISRTEL